MDQSPTAHKRHCLMYLYSNVWVYTDSKSTHNKVLTFFESMIYLLVVSVMARSETFSLMIAILCFIHFGDAY